MKASTKHTDTQPVLPKYLALPLKLVPAFVHNKTLVTTLNRVFSTELNTGELDFLQKKTIHIKIEDAGTDYFFSVDNNKFVLANKDHTPDLALQGTVYNYLLLASRQEDTDTLFFSRRLKMQGDTELGLYVKNFLDGIDMDTHKLPAYFESLLQKGLPVYKRLFGNG